MRNMALGVGILGGSAMAVAVPNTVAQQQWIPLAGSTTAVRGGTAGQKAGHGLVYALAGVGALFVVLVIWALAHSGSE